MNVTHTTTQIIAKEGWNQVAFALMVFLLSWSLSFLPWLFFGIFMFTLFIYRNPERLLEEEEEDELAFFAPIDGKIMQISKVQQDNGNEMLSVVIKKKILDVGILRAPMSLSIINVEKRHGLFLSPNSSLFSSLGEKNMLTCKGVFATIIMVISAGRFSQRIEIFDQLGIMKVGQRLGFLNDGEITLLLPLDARIKVSVGDEVKAGTHVLGYFAYKANDVE